MSIVKATDHFTVLSEDLGATQAFYEKLGLVSGPRPDFAFDGLWLYVGERPILHVVKVGTVPSAKSVLDHMAFSGVDCNALLAYLSEAKIGFKISQLPAPFHTWQVFFLDPNGAKVEIDFDGADSPDDRYLGVSVSSL